MESCPEDPSRLTSSESPETNSKRQTSFGAPSTWSARMTRRAKFWPAAGWKFRSRCCDLRLEPDSVVRIRNDTSRMAGRLALVDGVVVTAEDAGLVRLDGIDHLGLLISLRFASAACFLRSAECARTDARLGVACKQAHRCVRASHRIQSRAHVCVRFCRQV